MSWGSIDLWALFIMKREKVIESLPPRLNPHFHPLLKMLEERWKFWTRWHSFFQLDVRKFSWMICIPFVDICIDSFLLVPPLFLVYPFFVMLKRAWEHRTEMISLHFNYMLENVHSFVFRLCMIVSTSFRLYQLCLFLRSSRTAKRFEYDINHFLIW